MQCAEQVKGQKRYKSSKGYQEARESQSITRKGFKLSEEHKAKNKSQIMLEQVNQNWNTGKKWNKIKS